jgi:predicted HTH transcriptional regulator
MGNLEIAIIVQLVVFLMGFATGGIFVWMVLEKKYFQKGVIRKIDDERIENKQKIIDFLKDNDKVTNNDVEDMLSVSNSTAYRYLEELEQENIVRQVGKAGRSVYYEKK